MEAFIRYTLILIGLIIISLILWDRFRRDKEQRSVPVHPAAKELAAEEQDEEGLSEEELSGEEFIAEEPAEKEPTDEDSAEEELAEEAPLNVDQLFPENTAEQQPPEIIQLYVMAKTEEGFGGYDLVQAILANDMQYGEMQIFHRYQDVSDQTQPLFSLVSATEPGDFNLSEIGNLSCRGLILFMRPQEIDQPLEVFESMLKTAIQLAKDLQGDLRINRNDSLKVERLDALRSSLGGV